MIKNWASQNFIYRLVFVSFLILILCHSFFLVFTDDVLKYIYLSWIMNRNFPQISYICSKLIFLECFFLFAMFHAWVTTAMCVWMWKIYEVHKNIFYVSLCFYFFYFFFSLFVCCSLLADILNEIFSVIILLTFKYLYKHFFHNSSRFVVVVVERKCGSFMKYKWLCIYSSYVNEFVYRRNSLKNLFRNTYDVNNIWIIFWDDKKKERKKVK